MRSGPPEIRYTEHLYSGANMPSWLFEACRPNLSYGRWWFVVQGEERRSHGPYPTEAAALDARLRLFQAWAGRARFLGGEALRLRDDRWVVTLPEGTPCAGKPFRGEAVARHAVMQTDKKVG
jgi:hypothetical protein